MWILKFWGRLGNSCSATTGGPETGRPITLSVAFTLQTANSCVCVCLFKKNTKPPPNSPPPPFGLRERTAQAQNAAGVLEKLNGSKQNRHADSTATASGPLQPSAPDPEPRVGTSPACACSRWLRGSQAARQIDRSSSSSVARGDDRWPHQVGCKGAAAAHQLPGTFLKDQRGGVLVSGGLVSRAAGMRRSIFQAGLWAAVRTFWQGNRSAWQRDGAPASSSLLYFRQNYSNFC